MVLQGDNLKSVYMEFQSSFHRATDLEFKFKKGEKTRVKRIFTLVSESMGVRDPEDIAKVLNTFGRYIEKTSLDWLLWNKSCRQNYFGFVDNKENIKLFVKGLTTTAPKTVNEEIVKTRTNDQWDW